MHPATRTVSMMICLTMMFGMASAELPSANEVRRSTGVGAGLAVILGTTDGTLEAGIAADGRVLVQGVTHSLTPARAG